MTLIVMRGLPGAIPYHNLETTYTGYKIISPWNFVRWSRKYFDGKEVDLITSQDWKEAHTTARSEVGKACGDGSNVLVWFEYDKFYHLVDFWELAESIRSEFQVLDVFDNGLSNYELMDNAQQCLLYKDSITGKYIQTKRSKWHHKWRRQK